MTRRWRRRGRVFLLQGVMGLLHALPRGLAIELSALVARAGGQLDVRRRGEAEAQLRLRLRLPAPEARRVARALYAHFGRMVAELAHPPPPAFIDLSEGSVRVIETALEESRGAFFVSAHYGNWELIGPRLSAEGFRVAVIARPLRPPALDDWLSRWRRALGVQPIVRSSTGSPWMIRQVLGSSGLVGVLLDQAIPSLPSVRVDFFGAGAETPIGLARLALRGGIPVLAGFIERSTTAPHRHSITVERVPLPVHGTFETRARALTADLTRRIENAVRRRPDHWVWFHGRWATYD